MTATRVVGRRTPVELAARPAIVLKIVLLPAPVGPTRRTTTGRIEGSGTHADVTAQVVRELAGTGGRGLAPRAQRQAALRE